MEHSAETSSTCECALYSPDLKRRKDFHATYPIWECNFDRECSTMSWLDCETHVSAWKKFVAKLWCSIYKKYKERIAGRRNFSECWIVGADSVRMSNIQDHLHADQYIHAMPLLKKELTKAGNSACCSYSSPLDDLLLIAMDETPLADFSPNSAIDLWWKDKRRRPNQQKRKSCEQIPSTTSATPSTSASAYCPESDSDSEQIQDILFDWDNFN